jgi:hypothetical protein
MAEQRTKDEDNKSVDEQESSGPNQYGYDPALWPLRS